MQVSRVAGIDWDARPEKRSLVVLKKSGGSIGVERVESGLNDEDIRGVCTNAGLSALAVDTPFGWPKPFVDFVRTWSPKPIGTLSSRVPSSQKFVHRTTERTVKKDLEFGRGPLSVLANWWVASASLEWARVLREFGLFDRIDVGVGLYRKNPSIIEFHPAASTAALSSKFEGSYHEDYSKEDSVREALVCGLLATLDMAFDEDRIKTLVGRRGAGTTDAFVGALTALAYIERLPGWSVRRPVTHEELKYAPSEGWIFYPVPV